MFERFARQARDAVTLAIAEAGRRGDRKVATDHLLIGVLHDPAIAQQVGAGPEAARREADRIDHDALMAIGVDVDAFGTLAPAVGGDRLPFTPGAKAVLKRTLAHTTAEKARHIETRHLLRALTECEAPDPAAQLLAALRAGPDA
jgi:ATP-dependent Clp protease ATP-binding subunit ClpA